MTEPSTDALMVELVGHKLATGPCVIGLDDDGGRMWWTWWACRCGFHAVGEADLAPLIQRWHDEATA